MKKKHFKRSFIGKIKQVEPEIWISEDELSNDPQFQFIQKLHHVSSMDSTFQPLIDLGFLRMRTNQGKREYSLDRQALKNARNQLPPEVRNNPRSIKIYEDTAIICDYDNEMTTLLSVITEQTDKLIENPSVIPWIYKTREQLEFETMSLKNLSGTFEKLEAKNFVEITENGPENYRYRLNVSNVQSAINALPDLEDGEVAE